MSRFVIQTAQSGPPGLPTQLPAAGFTVNVLPGPRGAVAFHAVLEYPLRFYVDSRFDSSRVAPERMGRDERGLFVWVSEIVISPHRVDEQPHPGMTNFAMDMYAVVVPIDPDSPIDETTTAPMGLVLVDDAPEAADAVPDDAPSAAPPVPAVEPPTHTTTARTRPPAIPPPVPITAATSAAAGAALLLTEAVVQGRVRQMREQIASVLGWPVVEVQEPKCVKVRKEKKQGEPAYSVHRGTLRYFTKDVWDGFVLRETTDVDELLYWIADDLTRIAAWEWTKRTPSFGTVNNSELQRVIAMPMWHTLMYALRHDWGRRTRSAAERRSSRAGGA